MSLWKRAVFPGRTALAVLGLPAAECILVGDRIETDLPMGIEAGMKTGLVLTRRHRHRRPGSPTLS